MSFIDATRQNIKKQASVQFSASNTLLKDLKRVGLLAKVIVRFSGSYTLTHASKTTATKAALAPFNLVKWLRMNVNAGINLVKASGYMLHCLMMVNDLNHKLDSIIGTSDVFRFGNTVSVGGTANNLDFTLEIPLMINDRDPVGLFLLQNNETIANIEIDTGAFADLFTDTDITISNATGNFFFHTEIFSLPREAENQPDLRLVHQIIEDQYTVSSTGENPVPVKRGGWVRRMINLVTINGSPAANTAIDELALRYQQSHDPYTVLAPDQRALQRKRYGRDLDTGVYVWDGAYQGGFPGMGNHRDYLDTRAFTDIENIVMINSGASLGTNNNSIRVLREQLVPLRKRGA